jgi:hypothetical protein
MKTEELKEIVNIIERAFEKNPNAPVGELVVELRNNANYRKLAAITLFGMKEESCIPVSLATGVANATATALEPQPACHRIGIHMVPVGMKKCQLCGKEIE